MLLHLECNVHTWKSETMRQVDALLAAQGSVKMTLPWKSLDLLDDGEHFTPVSQMSFEREFSLELQRRLRGRPSTAVLIVGDSTIGHHDWHGDEWHGAASRRLAKAVQERLGCQRVEVDAVCGSGFVARAEHNEHFHARLAKWMRKEASWSVVVLVGGWNDEGTDATRLCRAIEGVCRTATKRP